MFGKIRVLMGIGFIFLSASIFGYRSGDGIADAEDYGQGWLAIQDMKKEEEEKREKEEREKREREEREKKEQEEKDKNKKKR